MTTNVIVRTDEDVLAVVGETDAGQLLGYCTSAAGVAKTSADWERLLTEKVAAHA
jgi:hypothetical protein